MAAVDNTNNYVYVPPPPPLPQPVQQKPEQLVKAQEGSTVQSSGSNPALNPEKLMQSLKDGTFQQKYGISAEQFKKFFGLSQDGVPAGIATAEAGVFVADKRTSVNGSFGTRKDASQLSETITFDSSSGSKPAFDLSDPRVAVIATSYIAAQSQFKGQSEIKRMEVTGSGGKYDVKVSIKTSKGMTVNVPIRGVIPEMDSSAFVSSLAKGMLPSMGDALDVLSSLGFNVSEANGATVVKGNLFGVPVNAFIEPRGMSQEQILNSTVNGASGAEKSIDERFDTADVQNKRVDLLISKDGCRAVLQVKLKGIDAPLVAVFDFNPDDSAETIAGKAGKALDEAMEARGLLGRSIPSYMMPRLSLSSSGSLSKGDLYSSGYSEGSLDSMLIESIMAGNQREVENVYDMIEKSKEEFLMWMKKQAEKKELEKSESRKKASYQMATADSDKKEMTQARVEGSSWDEAKFKTAYEAWKRRAVSSVVSG